MDNDLKGLIIAFIFFLICAASSIHTVISNTNRTLKEMDKVVVNTIRKSGIIYVTTEYNLADVTYEKFVVNGVKITAYNNERRQTDSTPNTMASNRIVYEGAVAISSDIVKKYKLKFGDIVYIPVLGSYFVFEDKMGNGRKENERTITNTIDIFTFDKEHSKNFRHLNQEVIIYKLPRNQ